MKKLLVAVATVVAVGAIGVGFATASDGPKLVDSGFTCGILDGNGNTVITNTSELWVTSNGQVILKCSGFVDRGPGPWPVITTGFLCGLGPYGLTNNSFSKVGYNGHSQLTCKGSTGDAAAAGGYGAS